MSFTFHWVVLNVISILNFQHSEASISLNGFLRLFKTCTVKLYNYPSIHLDEPTVPLSIFTNKRFQLDSNHRSRTRLPFHCLALFYIQPSREPNITEAEGERDRYDDYWISRYRPMDTKMRYDILVTDNNFGDRFLWNWHYEHLISSKVSSYGLILSLESSPYHRDSGYVRLGDEIEIVNRIQLVNSSGITAAANIYQILETRSRSTLDRMVQDVNDIRNNRNIPWKLTSRENPFFHPRGSFLHPDSVSSEGMEDYLIARIALGSGAVFKQGYEFDTQFPTIRFGVPGGTIMRNAERRDYGFITCANISQPAYFTYGFRHVVRRFLGQFEERIHVSVGVFYLIPAILLGGIYHGLLKQYTPKMYWLKWDPFTWGIRALIEQAGDRRWNSKRFGWMALLVTPWLLGSVVLRNAFKGSNIYFLNLPSSRLMDNSWVRYTAPRMAKVIPMAGSPPGTDSYGSIADLVRSVPNVAYLSHMDRITAVAKQIFSERSWEQGTCDDGMKVRRGYVSKWLADDLETRRADRYYGDQPKGWEILNCGDVRLIQRLNRLAGESGIVESIRKQVSLNMRGKPTAHYHSYIQSATMMGNIKWVFVLGLCALAVALVAWILEGILWKLYTQPKRKRQARYKKQREELLEMIKVEVAPVDGGDGDNVGGKLVQEAEVDAGDDVVAAAVALVDERTRKGSTESSKSNQTDGEKDTIAKDKKVSAMSPDADNLKDVTQANDNEVVNKNVEDENLDGIDPENAVKSEETESALGTEMDTLELGSDSANSVKDVESEDEFSASYEPSAPTEALDVDVDITNPEVDKSDPIGNVHEGLENDQTVNADTGHKTADIN